MSITNDMRDDATYMEEVLETLGLELRKKDERKENEGLTAALVLVRYLRNRKRRR